MHHQPALPVERIGVIGAHGRTGGIILILRRQNHTLIFRRILEDVLGCIGGIDRSCAVQLLDLPAHIGVEQIDHQFELMCSGLPCEPVQEAEVILVLRRLNLRPGDAHGNGASIHLLVAIEECEGLGVLPGAPPDIALCPEDEER